MPTDLANGPCHADNVCLAGSTFTHSSLEGAKFHDVNLRGAEFVDVALTGARLSNLCLGDVTIADANYAGMRIEGILVTELLRVYRQQAAAPEAAPPGTA
ncbi:MAG: pentapeptide repeat-containing protein [Betaproteobacteria bacterium]|nr:pentapeptide repeat-containing protein [Betaproteobacteria bacterium]